MKRARICSLDLIDDLSVTAALSSIGEESAADQISLSESLNTVIKNTQSTQGVEHLVGHPGMKPRTRLEVKEFAD